MDDAPTPYITKEMTPGNANVKIKEKNFNIISDKDRSFVIKFINYLNYIEINAYLKNNEITNIYYQKIYYLEELKSNKFLSICDSIDEIYEQIIFEVEKNSKKNLIEKNNEINLIIPIEHTKIKEIIFNLPEKKKNDKILIKDLFIEIYNLNESKIKSNQAIIELKNEINILKNDIINLKNENKKLSEKNNLLEKQIKKILLENNNNISDCKPLSINYLELNKSSIVNNDIVKQDLIINWIKEAINKSSIKFELIFKMSVNGSESVKFHKYCDNKGPTLLLIKTTKKKIFGGFTPHDWSINKGEVYDKLKQTFIFSLNLMKKYNMLSIKKEAIICRRSGPIFGCDDIMIQFDMKKGETYANEFCNYLSDNNLELIEEKGNKGNFDTEELEVFKVVY